MRMSCIIANFIDKPEILSYYKNTGMIKLLSGKCILQENRRQLPFYIRIRYKHIKSYIIVYDNLFSYIS